MGPEPELEEEVVEDVVLEDDELLLEEDEEDDDEEDVVPDAHVSVIVSIGRGSCGRGIEEMGVPVGTSTVNVYWWPPSTVTVTLQVSAEATGIAARPNTTSNALVVTHAIKSFRLLSTVLQLLQPLSRRSVAPRNAA